MIGAAWGTQTMNKLGTKLKLALASIATFAIALVLSIVAIKVVIKLINRAAGKQCET